MNVCGYYIRVNIPSYKKCVTGVKITTPKSAAFRCLLLPNFTRNTCKCGMSNGKSSRLYDLKYLDLQVGPSFRYSNGGKSEVTSGPIFYKGGAWAGTRFREKHRQLFMHKGESGFDAETQKTTSGFPWGVKGFINWVIP